MRSYAWLFLSIGLTFSLVGCGDSGSSGGGGSAGNGGSGGTATATVSGAVLDDEDEPFVGAMVSVGTATATSGSGGAFTIESPVGTQLFLTKAADHWGSLIPEVVPSQGRNDVELFVISETLVEGIGTALGVPVDINKGIVSVSFDDATAAAGDKATISAGSGGSFVLDGNDDPFPGNALLASGIVEGNTEVIFVNVDLTNGVSVQASTASDAACPLEFPTVTYPVEEKVITDIAVICP